MKNNIRVKIGKGVLSKDNKTPFAAQTFHYLSKDGMNCVADYSMNNVSAALRGMMAGDIVGFSVIFEDNTEITFSKDGLVVDAELSAALRAEHTKGLS